MKEKLIKLYQKTSKHSNYQILPQAVREVVEQEEVVVSSRFERQRLQYLKENLTFKNKKVLDIGGNTGYFSFQVLDEGAKEVIYIEGNTHHADFVRMAADYLGKNITIENRYLDFENAFNHSPVDVTLLFNVVHHLGDDFGQRGITLAKAKEKMKNCINYFAGITDILVLQMGYCWKGDTTKLIFENGTKKEMIDFVNEATQNNWEMQAIGIAEKNKDNTVYKPLKSDNLHRDDSLGEFRNRPIFILKSMKR